MSFSSKNSQKINLEDLETRETVGRKATRIELRLLRDAYNLSSGHPKDPDTSQLLNNNENSSQDSINLKRLTAYCTADHYDLKNLYGFFKMNDKCEKVQMYFGECIYARLDNSDVYFLEYGVVVCWGLEEKNEQVMLKIIKNYEKDPYDFKAIESENFMYGIASEPVIVNDKIYLKDDSYVTKMVLSTAIAQSVKLDYFEELVDQTIEHVKDLPAEVEKEGELGKTRTDLFKIMGKLHKLSFNLNLASNILDEPDLIWHFDSYSPMYETCLRYLDIKSRADILNRRFDIIHTILEILSTNITTHNSETLEKRMTSILGASAGFGLIQCVLLAILIYFIRK